MKNEVTVVKAPEMEKVVESTKKVVRANLKEKVAYVKGIVYAPKKIRMGTWSESFKEDMSKAYAFKSNVYDVDSKYRNNIAYLSDQMSELEEKEELTEQEKARYALCKADRAKAQACLHAWTKAQRVAIQPTLDDIASRLYAPYVQRQVNEDGWKKAVYDYLESYDMKCHDTVVKYLSDNVGSRLAKTKDWATCMVDNMVVNQFAELVLALFLQLGIDKAQFDTKIVDKELEGTKLIMMEEFDSFKTIRRLDPMYATVAEYKAVLKEVGAEMPKSTAKKADYVKAYAKAKKQGLFVEYSC